MNRLKSVFEGLRERIESLGYEYIGVELITENAMKILRVYADMESGLSVDDCEKIARESNEFLDQHEAVLPERYFLEVSSPGIERPLFSAEDYRGFIGKDVLLKLRGQKQLSGTLKAVSGDGVITIAAGAGSAVSIPFSEIRRGNLVFAPKAGTKKTFKKISKKKK